MADRVLREVGFDQRLVGYRMRERTGPMPASLYSFEEVVHLLNDKLPFVDLRQLRQWVETVTEDAELATAVADAIREETNDRDRMLRIKTLMGERLCQCKKVVHS
ncbi:MAG: hypothetical protein V3R99_12980 [Thermoguttaceae bacterium]